MSKVYTILFAAIAFCFSAQGANILFWNYDPEQEDTFPDPEVGQMITASYWLKTTLTNNGYKFTHYDGEKLPADISSYDLIIAEQGFCAC